MKAFALTLALALISAPANAEPIAPAEITVIDGDTLRAYGHPPNIRLVGFNAPETWRAACPTEQQLGARATQRLRELVRGGELDFQYVACSCPTGTQGTPACNYGRACGILKSAGHDVGAILIAERLAVPFVCGTTRCPPTPRPWCP